MRKIYIIYIYKISESPPRVNAPPILKSEEKTTSPTKKSIARALYFIRNQGFDPLAVLMQVEGLTKDDLWNI